MIQKQRANRRFTFLPQIIFLVLTFATAVSGTFVALKLFGDNEDENIVPEIITVEIIVTATPVPASIQTKQPDSSDSGQVDLPANLSRTSTGRAVATLDADQLGAVDAAISTPTVEPASLVPENCKFHTVVSGDTAYGIANFYGVNLFVVLEANNLTNETAVQLQIGDVLLVPLEGCSIEGQDFNPSELAGNGLPAATSTPPQIQIDLGAVEAIGDVTAEVIHLRNTGREINISNWTLNDSDGNSYRFPGLLLFSDAEIAIFTRSGTSTEGALFWGSDASVWQAGELLTIIDTNGLVRRTLQIPDEAPSE